MVAAMDTPHFPVQVDGKNYDIKKFLRDHPGGVNTLKHYEGKSILQAMEKFGHSISAYHMLNDFKVDSELKDCNLTGSVSENGRIITNEEESRDKAEIAYLEELEVKFIFRYGNFLPAALPISHQLVWQNLINRQ